MKADKPNFTDSELYFMEDIIKEDRQRWINKYSKYDNFEEIKDEYDSILKKLKNFRTEEHNWNKAINSLIKK